MPRRRRSTHSSKRHPALADELSPAAQRPQRRRAHACGCASWPRNTQEIRELLPPADLDVAKLRRFAEDEIEARFERVPGVSQSTTFGGLEDELQVVVDPEKLAARRLTLTDVRDVLRSQNEDTSAGDFWEGKRRWVVRAMGQFRSPEQVENQLLAIRDGAPVFVRDVAEVRLGYKKPDGFVRRFGESSIAVNATRETGANVLDVMAGLQEASERAQPRLAEPARAAAHASLRRNRVHLLGHRPGEGQHLRRRRAHDGRADAVPAPGSAHSAGDSVHHGHGASWRRGFAVVLRHFGGIDRGARASGSPAAHWSSAW